MRRYIDTITEEHIKRDDQPGYDIELSLSDLGRSPGEEPPEIVKLFAPSGDRIVLKLMSEATDREGKHLYWSYWNSEPDEPIHLMVKDQSLVRHV